MKKKKLLTDKSGALYDQMIDEAAKQMAADIDFEVLISMYIDSGWTKVVLQPMTWEAGLDVDGWVEKNVKDSFETRGLVWVFKNPKEAMWFKMRWLA